MSKQLTSIELWERDRSVQITPSPSLKGAVLGMVYQARLGEIPTLTLTLPNGCGLVEEVAGGTPIRVRRTIKRIFSDGSVDWWRIVRLSRRYDGENEPTIECWGLDADLRDAVPRRVLSDGRIDMQITLTNLTLTQALTELFSNLNPPQGFALGTIDSSLSGQSVYLYSAPNTFRECFNKLCEQLTTDTQNCEWQVRYVGATVLVDFVKEVGRSSAEISAGSPLPQRRPIALGGNVIGNRLKNDRTVDAQDVFSRVIPLGNEDGGESANAGTLISIQDAEWRVVSAVFGGTNTTLTVQRNPIYANNAPSLPLWFGRSGVGWFPIVSTTSPNIIVVTGNASTLSGALGRFATSSGGNGLTYLDLPTAISSIGIAERTQTFSEIPPFENVLERDGVSVDMSAFSSGLPNGAAIHGSAPLPTVTQESSALYVKYGTSSARVVAAKDKGLKWAVAFDPTVTAPVYSVWMSIRLISGAVRLEVVDSLGNIHPVGKKAVSTVRELRALTIEGITPAQGVGAVRIVAETSSAEFVVDAITVTRSSSAYEYFPDMGAVGLWKAASKILLKGAGLKEEYHNAEIVDVSETSCTANPSLYDEIVLGSYVEVKEDYDYVAATHRTVFNARVADIRIEEWFNTGRAFKNIRLKRNPNDIFPYLLSEDKRPRLSKVLDTLEPSIFPTVSGKAFIGAYVPANSGFEARFSYQGNQYTQSVAWIVQSTAFTAEPTTAQWAAAIASNHFINGQNGTNVLASILASEYVAPMANVYIALMPYSALGATGTAGQKAVMIEATSKGGVETEPVPVQVNFSSYSEAQLKLYIKDPLRNVASVKMRAYSGSFLPPEASLPFGIMSAATDAHGTYYYLSVLLDEGHNSVIEWLITGVDSSVIERDTVTFDPDIIPSVNCSLVLGNFLPPTSLLPGRFEVKLNWNGDEDTASVGVNVSKTFAGSFFPTTLNARAGKNTVINSGTEITFGETLYVRVRAYSGSGQSGRVNIVDWEGAIQAPLDSSAYLPDGSIVAQKLVKGSQQFTTNLGWSGPAYDTINWSSGTIKMQDGTLYGVSGGSTGAMMAGVTYYAYFDPSVSTTNLQLTTNWQDVVSNTAFLVAVCKAGSNAGGFPFVVPSNSEQLLINAAHINVLSLEALSANMGKLTAGEILLGNTTTFGAGYTGLRMFKDPFNPIYNFTGYNGGVEQVKFDSDGRFYAGAGKVKADAAGLSVKGDTYASGLAFLLSLTSGSSGQINLLDALNTKRGGLGLSTIGGANYTTLTGTDNMWLVSGGSTTITTQSGQDILLQPSSGNVRINGNRIWHEGNDGHFSGLDADLLDGYHANSFVKTVDYNGGDILDMIMGYDGSGSGLDADMLDGNHASAFAPVTHSHSAGDITSGTLSNARLNMGAGGGINADLLDGYHSNAFARLAQVVSGSSLSQDVRIGISIGGQDFWIAGETI